MKITVNYIPGATRNALANIVTSLFYRKRQAAVDPSAALKQAKDRLEIVAKEVAESSVANNINKSVFELAEHFGILEEQLKETALKSATYKMKQGTTTRIIDRCIQELFKNGLTFLYDGRGEDNQTEATFAKFIARLQLEHPKAKYHYKKVVESGIECYKVESHNL